MKNHQKRSAKADNTPESNRFIKLLVFQSDEQNFLLLYGFSVPTRQRPRGWTGRRERKTRRYIWTTILPRKEAELFEQSLTTPEGISMENMGRITPQLVRRDEVLCGNPLLKESGPVTELSRLTEFWNVRKTASAEQLRSSFGSDGKQLLRDIQDLFVWVQQECGIDFLKDGSRFGNYERYDPPASEYSFEIQTHKELGLKTTTIKKAAPYNIDLLVNCAAEHRGRILLDQVKLFPAGETVLEFTANEPMSRTIIRIWEVESGKLVYSSDETLMMNVSFIMNYSEPVRQIQDAWTQKLYASATNRGDVIKGRIETLSRSTLDRTVTIRSSTHNQIDSALEEGPDLFASYRRQPCKGAFIPNIQLDGEIESFLKIREYIDQHIVKKVVIADPYFSVYAAAKLLTRIPRTDLQIDVITSLGKKDPDNEEETDICQKYRAFMEKNRAVFHENLTICNLRRGGKQVFHDRYLIRYLNDGTIDGFMLSNSINSMGQAYPLVIVPLECEICLEVCEYLNGLRDSEVQEKLPKRERITCEILFNGQTAAKTTQKPPNEPIQLEDWLPSWYDTDRNLTMKREEVPTGVSAIWVRWPDEKENVIRALGLLGIQTHLWPANCVAQALRAVDGAAETFLKNFPSLARERERFQDHTAQGVNSEEYTLWALLNGQAKPTRQGFRLLLREAGHIWYDGTYWLQGGYALLLELDAKAFAELFAELKSPLMFDVLALHLLFYPWDNQLYRTLLDTGSLYLDLLCAEALFYRLEEEAWPLERLTEALAPLTPERRARQNTYLLSRSAFSARTSQKDQDDQERWVAIRWLLLGLAASDLPKCSTEDQKVAVFWLYDCEGRSQCALCLELADLVEDPLKRELLERAVSTSAQELLDCSYDHDVSDYVELYLYSAEQLYGQETEEKIFLQVLNRRALEDATEPQLKNYAYQRWHRANISAKRQMEVFHALRVHHPQWEKVEKWLDTWEDRINEGT